MSSKPTNIERFYKESKMNYIPRVIMGLAAVAAIVYMLMKPKNAVLVPDAFDVTTGSLSTGLATGTQQTGPTTTIINNTTYVVQPQNNAGSSTTSGALVTGKDFSDHTIMYRALPLHYQNAEYGFSLTFPQTWSDMKVGEQTRRSADGKSQIPIFRFGRGKIATGGNTYDESVFAISVYTKDQRQDVSQYGGTHKIAENNSHVFALGKAQAVGFSSDFNARYQEIDAILKTFTLVK